MEFNYALALLLAAAVSAFVARSAWIRRAYKGSQTLAVILYALSWWSFSYALYWLKVPPQGFFWLDATYLGVVIVPGGLLAFVLQFSGQANRVSKRLIGLLVIEPVLALLLLWTDPLHGLFFGSRPETLGTILNGGIAFYTHVAYSYLLILFSFGYMLYVYTGARGLFRQQLGTVLLGMAIPLVTNLISLVGVSVFPNLDLTPLMFTISGLIFAFALFRLRMLDIVPIARDALVEQMMDGVIVLDVQQRIVDINPAAIYLLGLPRTGSLGAEAISSLDHWPKLNRMLNTLSSERSGTQIKGSNDRTLDVHVAPLYNRGAVLNGRLIILRDISDQVSVEKALRQANEGLKERIREIEKLQAQLHEQAIRDPLTDAFNRRYLEASLPREISQVKRKGEPISVAMVDIDFFKNFNDEHGHAAGDKMLQNLATILRESTRAGDIVCRYGGEEFAVVLPGASQKIALERIEYCRHVFENKPIQYEGEKLNATLSAGIASYPKDGENAARLLDQADKAMYLAKQRGRNQALTTADLKSS